MSGLTPAPLPRGDRARLGLKTLATVVLALMTLLTLGPASPIAEAKALPAIQPVQPPKVSRQLPCDVYSAAGTPCVAALSTVRALYARYDGPLYKVQRVSDGATRDIGVLAPGGYADAVTQTAFCSQAPCTITEIYDQSPEGNNLYVEGGGGHGSADIGAPANALPVTAGGEEVYGVEMSAGMGYRNDQTKGMPVGDEPQGIYMVTSGTHVNSRCCFDFGNAEVNNNDNGNGHMDALNFSTQCWLTCNSSGPWAQADLENGLFQSDGRGSPGPQNAGTARLPFVTAMLMNNGLNYFALEEGDAQSGGLSTEYAGPEPYMNRHGYSPMHQEGAIVLGTGGDDSNLSIGSFFEGVITAGIPPASANEAVQENIVSVGYGRPTGSVGSLAPGSEVSLRVTSPTSSQEYVRTGSYDNDAALIAPVRPTSSPEAKAQSTWLVQPGLADSSCVSFAALSDPGAYLESEDFTLYVSPDDGSLVFARDATFCARTVGGSRDTIFQSYAHPNMYIRHDNEQVYLASDGGTNDWDVFLISP
jgi:non-reducing end alpha-L-arabinofuranosidase